MQTAYEGSLDWCHCICRDRSWMEFFENTHLHINYFIPRCHICHDSQKATTTTATKKKVAQLVSISCMKIYDILISRGTEPNTSLNSGGQTPPLDCQSRCCISSTCDGKMIHWACQDASRDCVYWGVLFASIDKQEGGVCACVCVCVCVRESEGGAFRGVP